MVWQAWHELPWGPEKPRSGAVVTAYGAGGGCELGQTCGIRVSAGVPFGEERVRAGAPLLSSWGPWGQDGLEPREVPLQAEGLSEEL